MSLTKIQPSALDTSKNYSVNQLTANTVVAGGVDLYTFANAAFTSANAAGSSATVTAAYNTANNANIYANGAFVQANTATTSATNANIYANGAFVQANTATTSATNANIYANGAFVQANTATTLGTSAYGQANTATTLGTSAYGQANTATTSATNANIYANGAFTQANSSYVLANAAFAKANTSSGSGITYTAANTAPVSPKIGDQWYKINQDILFEYTNDGTSNNWVDVTTPTTIYSTSGVTIGTYGGSNAIPVVTIDAYGRVTSAANTSINIPSGTSVFANSGQLTANSSTGNVLLGLAATSVTAGAYGSSTVIPTITVDTYGRITAVSNNSFNAGITYTSGNTAPVSPKIGDQWYKINQDILFEYTNDGTSNNWVDVTTPTTIYSASGAVAGTYGGSTSIPVVTVDTYGRVTSAANTSITIPAGTSVYANSGQLTANAATGNVLLGLATTAVSSGTYGGASNTVTITVDAYGRITSLANNAISSSGGGATLSAVAAATTYYIGLSAASTGSWTDARVDTSNLYYSSATSTLYSTNFNTSSDENLKSSIQTIRNGLDIVNALRGVGFNWNSNGLKSYGVIAQEIEKIIPDIVEDSNGRKTVNYNAIIGFLIEAIKTQSTQIQTLEERITKLEEK